MKAASREAAIGTPVQVSFEQDVPDGIPDEVASEHARLCYKAAGVVRDVELKMRTDDHNIYTILDADVIGIEGRFFDR